MEGSEMLGGQPNVGQLRRGDQERRLDEPAGAPLVLSSLSSFPRRRVAMEAIRKRCLKEG